jgi:hypothetical protein
LRSARIGALLAAVAVPASPARAQQLTSTELTAAAFAALGERPFWAAAGGVGRRIDNQIRVAALGAWGMLDGDLGMRVEVTGQLIVNPSGRGGAGLYAGTGVAWQGGRGTPGSGYITALIGLETAPGAKRGWVVEAGLGGGVRITVGWRWRRFPPWWR